MSGTLQILGALLVLAPFALLQLGLVRPDAGAYLWLNLVGSAILAVLAVIHEQWGFLLLEGVWAIVAAWGLTRLARRDSRSPSVDANVSHC
jgi:hypothetical protein